jgi:hypothetical protein
MTEWHNIRAVLIRMIGVASVMGVGAVWHAFATGCWT